MCKKKIYEDSVLRAKNEANATISKLNKQLVFERAKMVAEQQENSNNLEFKKLLLLHGKDRRKQSMETELEKLPQSISYIESKIEIENATIASATQELRNLEIESNSLENEINSISEQIVRQKKTNS